MMSTQHFLGLAGMTILFFTASWLVQKVRDITGSNNPFFGKKHTEEAKQKISESRSKKNPNMARDVAGKKNPFFGKRHDADTRAGMSKAKSGSINPMYIVSKSPSYL